MATFDIVLNRFKRTAAVTLGVMTIGTSVYFSVEDPVRELTACTSKTCIGKVQGNTAIPAGRYRVVDTYSPKFKRNMLMLLNVPGFQGIRIHAAGTYANNYKGTTDSTEGCLVLGLTGKETSVEQTKQAIERFNAQVRERLAKGDQVWITIKND